jgi:hypothetical protein
LNHDEDEWIEVFAVVADPETGAVVRIYQCASQRDSDPVTLGRLTAHMLLEAGAGPLLQSASGESQ